MTSEIKTLHQLSDYIEDHWLTNPEQDCLSKEVSNEKWVSVESEVAFLKNEEGYILSNLDDPHCIALVLESIRERIKQLEGEQESPSTSENSK